MGAKASKTGAAVEPPSTEIKAATTTDKLLAKPQGVKFDKRLWLHRGLAMDDRRMQAMGAKKLTGGWHSNGVWLLPGGVVEKRYGSGKSRGERMEIELYILIKILGECDFVPKVLGIDRKNRIVWMTYCGGKVTESINKRMMLDKQLRILESVYGVYRKENVGKQFYLIQDNNLTQQGDKLYIIDFGSKNWHVKRSPSEPLLIKRLSNPNAPPNPAPAKPL